MSVQEENKKIVTRFNKEFLEGANTDVLKEIVSDDFINQTATGVPKDVKGLIEFVKMLNTAFPDLHITIHEQVAQGDLVASRKTISATHLGEIFGKAPTGKKVNFSVMDFVRLKDGKYIEHWGQNNIMQIIGTL